MGTIQNDKLAVKVNDFGAELASIYDKENQREVVWQADAAFWKRHAPVLFPNVGKYYGGAFLYEGKHYKEGQHGFARDMMFEEVAKGEDFITHRLIANEETKKRYPFDFIFEVTHRLSDNEVTVEWKVKNVDNKTMYFTIGGHPAFNVPVLANTSFSDYALKFTDDKESLSYVLLDMQTGTAIVDKPYELKLTNHQYQLQSHMFDQDALIFDDSQIQWIQIVLPDGRPYVTVKCNDFTNFGIWSMPNAPYVCLEPWAGRCDDFGFSGEISSKKGINVLEAGAIFEKAYKIQIG